MNRFILEGTLAKVKYLEDSVVCYVDDIENGYRRNDGTIVDDVLNTWKVIFKADPFKNYINKFFKEGFVVEIDARMRPYALRNGEVIDGYSCYGIAINRGTKKTTIRSEKKIMRESQEASKEKPNLQEYMEDDF